MVELGVRVVSDCSGCVTEVWVKVPCSVAEGSLTCGVPCVSSECEEVGVVSDLSGDVSVDSVVVSEVTVECSEGSVVRYVCVVESLIWSVWSLLWFEFGRAYRHESIECGPASVLILSDAV